MSGVTFSMTIEDVLAIKEEMYLQGIIQGERNIEEQRLKENQLWQELTTKLRQLAEKHGATFGEVDSCWRVPEPREAGDGTRT